jgi:hypothetical protein
MFENDISGIKGVWIAAAGNHDNQDNQGNQSNHFN